jgi:hypothetical protein
VTINVDGSNREVVDVSRDFCFRSNYQPQLFLRSLYYEFPGFPIGSGDVVVVRSSAPFVEGIRFVRCSFS